MAHPIEKKIAERTAQIAEIDQHLRALEIQRATLSAEMNAYKDTLQYLQPGGSARARRSAVREPALRGISDAWAKYLATASMNGQQEFGIDDIVSAGEMHGAALKRPSVRTQAANMVTRGVLVRVSPGTFRVTEQGVSEIDGFDQSNESGEPSDPPENAEENQLFE